MNLNIYVRVCCAPTTRIHTHMIRTKHKGEREEEEEEERRDDGEGGKETIFIFQPSEEGK